METLNELIEALRTGGPYAMAAIFIAVWWLERRDRREHLESAGASARVADRLDELAAAEPGEKIR